MCENIEILLRRLTSTCSRMPALTSSLILIGCLAMITFPQEQQHFWVTPLDPDVFMGEMLNLTCTLNQQFINVSSDCLYFTKRFSVNVNCSKVPESHRPNSSCVAEAGNSQKGTYQQCAVDWKYVTIVNSTTVQLLYPVQVEYLDEGHYWCRALDGETHRDGVSITMYSVPVAVTNVSCVVENSSVMTCHWPLEHVPLKDEHLRVNLTWGIDEEPTSPCPEQTRTSCTWREDQLSMGSIYTMMVTLLTVSETSPSTILNSTQSEYFTINTTAIVRPPPVTGISSTIDNSTSCVWLSWQPDINHSVRCKVEYNCSLYQEECQFPTNIVSGETEICGLMPWTVYEWRVSCQPLRGGVWSHPSHHISETIIDAPYAPPQVHPGSYMESPCNKPRCRNITLYWQNIEPHLQNGELDFFRILSTDMGTGHWELYKEKYTGQTSYELSVRSDRNYDIDVTVCTKMGCSDRSNPIRVFKAGRGVPGPRGFTVEMTNDTNPTHLNMSWAPLPQSINVLTYTVFWCKGKQPKCQGALNWLSVAGDINAMNLTIPDLTKDTLRDYMIGVSAESKVKVTREKRDTSSGVAASSGVGWSPCLYGPPEVPNYELENVQTWSPNADTIDMAWNKLPCPMTPSAPTGVLVVYCTSDGSGCSGPEMQATSPPTASGHSLTGLDEAGTYAITLYPTTRAGVGPASGPFIATVQQDLGLVWTILITFVVLLLVLLVVFFIVWGIRKMLTPKDEVDVPGKEELLANEDVPPPPPGNPPPEGRSSVKNGNYKQNPDNDLENVQLLRADFYKENNNPRSSAPVRPDNCYMVPPSTKSNNRHSKRNSENNNKPVISGLEAKSDDSFPLLDFTDEGIPRERVSSFKGNLVTKDYGFAVKGQIDYEDLVNNQLEREPQSRRTREDLRRKPAIAYEGGEYPPPPSVTSVPAHMRGQKPVKKERRWSKGRPDSDGHKYDGGKHSPKRHSPEKRLSRDSDFPTPPPTPPMYHARDNRLSGQEFMPTPPPPPAPIADQEVPNVRYSGQFGLPSTPPPPIASYEGHRPEHRHTTQVYGIPVFPPSEMPKSHHRPQSHPHTDAYRPEHRHTAPVQVLPIAEEMMEVSPRSKEPPPVRFVPDETPRKRDSRPEPHQRSHYPQDVQPVVQPHVHAQIPSPKQRSRDSRPDPPTTSPPPREVEPLYRYPSQESTSPKRKRAPQPPKEVEPVFKYPSVSSPDSAKPSQSSPQPSQQQQPVAPRQSVPSPQPVTVASSPPSKSPQPAAAPVQRRPEPQQRTHPSVTDSEPKTPVTPITPDRLSKAMSEQDSDTLDISFLLGDLIGGGVSVRPPKQDDNDVVMRPKPRQNPPEPPKRDTSQEVVMRPKQPQQEADRGSKGKSNPPKVAPKPKKDSLYSKIATSPTQVNPPSARSSAASNPEYVKIT